MRLFRIALPLAFVVVVAGAYTRIADAGLGCPDWPGCYGKLAGVPSAAEAAEYLASGAKDAPGGFDRQKAVIEIAHRYIAGLLGLLILAAAFLARKDGRRYFVGAMLLVVLVCAQALLGMATVTDNLRPAVVLSHLLGGMLTKLTAPQSQPRQCQTTRHRRRNIQTTNIASHRRHTRR